MPLSSRSYRIHLELRRSSDLRTSQALPQTELHTTSVQTPAQRIEVRLRLNGREVVASVEARRTLAGLEELHPSRTILLFPDAGKADAIGVDVELKCFTIPGSSREVCSEVIQLRLGGSRSRVPGSIVAPLLITDLPTFCRWRGLPP